MLLREDKALGASPVPEYQLQLAPFSDSVRPTQHEGLFLCILWLARCMHLLMRPGKALSASPLLCDSSQCAAIDTIAVHAVGLSASRHTSSVGPIVWQCSSCHIEACTSLYM